MSDIRITKGHYSIVFDSETGAVRGLYDTADTGANWIASGEGLFFGAPFVYGTQTAEQPLPMRLCHYDKDGIGLSSCSGATTLQYRLLQDRIGIHLEIPPGAGPRAGVEMDLNLLDLPGDPWKQCMPVTIYTQPDASYAYFIFMTSTGRCMAFTVQNDFAAWRIKYNYFGHKMRGFQILSQADDVITGGRPPLCAVETLDMGISFGSYEECMQSISGMLGIAPVCFDISGGLPGTRIPLRFLGDPAQKTLIPPDGAALDLAGNGIVLDKCGLYQIVTLSAQGREHTGRILCQENWEAIFDKVNQFYAKHFQHGCGAFFRVIWKDTLSPEKGTTFEGVAFGDPEKIASCRSGEFGGYAAQAMMANCLLYGHKEKLLSSIDRYFNWILNRDRKAPLPGTVYRCPHTYMGRRYGAYHLWHEINYPQHEAFLLEQLADYYQLTGKAAILEDLTGLCRHFINEHTDNEGRVFCQNTANSHQSDYSTVGIPITALIRAAQTVTEPDDKKAFTDAAEKLADFVCKRGLDFPTEGDPCTEDGSMACSVITLLRAYRDIAPKPAYMETAKTILEHHRMLEMCSSDCRINGSSLRFWETQYETRDWGPSINAGHGWTIWTAEAKALMADECGDIDLLCESYNGFISNIAKVEENGGMPSCYTPDMIPGTPHGQAMYESDTIIDGDFPDLRSTSIPLAMGYVQKTYAASGNHFLIKGGELWSRISGISFKKGIAICGVLKGNRFTSAASHFSRLILDRAPPEPLFVDCECGKPITISVRANGPLHVKGGRVITDPRGFITVTPEKDLIEIFC
jgi:hypothetical protein